MGDNLISVNNVSVNFDYQENFISKKQKIHAVNNININFRLPKITHSDDTQFRVRITTVHHSTQSNTTSNNPTSGTAIAMTLPYVGGTFGYSK